MNGPVGELAVLALLILVNAFFAASEIAIVSVRKTRLKQLVDEGNREARIIDSLSENSSRLLATVQVGVTLVGFFSAAVGAIALADPFYNLMLLVGLPMAPEAGHSLAVTVITTVLAFLMLLLGELVPKTIALQHAEKVALAVARPVDALAHILAPMVGLLTWVTDLLVGLVGQSRKSTMPFVTAEEIMTMVDAGQEGGVIENTEKEMIYSIFEMGQTTTREVMVPRMDVFALAVETPLPEVISAAVRTSHTRIPVFEGNRDNIVGIVHTKDLLKCGQDVGPVSSLRDLLRPAYFVPESKKIDELLREMQAHQVHMAIAVDEYGGTAGLVTLEDVLEEIVGEIKDEYDKEEALMQPVGEGEAIFQGITPLNHVNETMGLELKADDVDSVGGYVYSQLGRIPAPGEKVVTDCATITVLSTAGRRIKKVKVTKVMLPHDEKPEPGAPGRD
jgi:putative hemolysin